MRIVKNLVLFLPLVALLAGCQSGSSITSECGTTEVTTLAGADLSGNVDGTGAAARFNAPTRLTSDGTHLYVADWMNQSVRKVTIATGEVTTLASGFPVHGITTDGTHVYVSHGQTLRKIVIATDAVTEMALSGTEILDGLYFSDLVTDGTYLYATEIVTNKIVKIAIANGEVTTLAGSGTAGNVDGVGTEAQFSVPWGIATDGTSLYVTSATHTIRKVVIATGEVTTIAGSGYSGGDDGTGTEATFKYPKGIATDGTNLYVADGDNNRVRKVVIATGKVTTLAGSGTAGGVDGAGKDATFNSPNGIVVDASASDGSVVVYVADYYQNKIRKIDHTPRGCATSTAESTNYSISGKVTGLTAKLVLQNNGSDDTTVAKNGKFEFAKTVLEGKAYAVAVKEQPNGQVCTVTKGSGTANAVVSDIEVSCEASATPPSDATPPAVPTIVDLTTVDRSPILTGTYDSADTAWFRVDVNNFSYRPGDKWLTTSGDNWTLTMAIEMATGVYDIVATAADAAGNFSTASGTLVIVEAPPAPTVTAVSTEDPTPTLSGTFDGDNAASFTVAVSGITYVMGTDETLITNGNSWNLTIPDANVLAIGTYNVVATATDAATAVKTDSTTNELVVRDGNATWSLEDVYTNDTTPTISGTFPTDASGLSVFLLRPFFPNGYISSFHAEATNEPGILFEAGRNVGTYNRATGEWQLTAYWGHEMKPLEEMTYFIRVSMYPDTTFPAAAARLVVDLTAPSAPTVTSQNTSNTTPTITGTFDAADADVLTVTVNSVTYTLGTDAALTSSSDTWSLIIPNANALTDGTYDVVATIKDKATNSTSDSTTGELVVNSDMTAPVVATNGLSPASGATGVTRTGGISVTFSENMFGSSISSSTFTLANGGSVSGTVSFDGSTTATFTPDSNLGMLTQYTATVTTGVTDLAGNPLASNQTWSFTTADGVWGVTPATVDISAEDNNGVRVVVDEQGNATAVWLQFNGTTNSVAANRYVSGSWGASPVTLESGTGDAAGVELAVDGNGNVFAVWQQADGLGIWGIWASRYDVGTTTWSAAVQIDGDTHDAGQPQVAVDGSGNAIVVWNETDGTRNNIWASRYAAGNWSTAAKIENDDTTDATAPAIAMDPAGNAIVVWHLGDGFMSGEIMATHYTGTWNTTAVVIDSDTNANLALGAQVAMDSNGNAIAVWVQDDGSVINVWANRYDAGTVAWGTATTITDGTGDGAEPQVAVDGSGNALVVWVQSNGNDVWSNQFAVASTTWGTAEKIDNLAGATVAPQIAMDTTGHGVAVWIQTDGLGRSSTFANRYVKDTGWSGAAVIETDDTYDNNMTRADLGMNTKGEAMAVWHQMQGSGMYDVWANSFE